MMNKIIIIIIMGALPSKLQTLPSSLKENQVIKMVGNNKTYFFHQRSIQTGIQNDILTGMFSSLLPINNQALNVFTNGVSDSYKSRYYVTQDTVDSVPLALTLNINENDFDIRNYIMGFIRSQQLNLDNLTFTVESKSASVKFGNNKKVIKIIKQRKKVLKEIEKNINKLRKLNMY